MSKFLDAHVLSAYINCCFPYNSEEEIKNEQKYVKFGLGKEGEG